MFNLYFTLGFEHILDINGYDHILFILALTIVYSFKELRQVIILVTAFTLGHSVSLALASLGYISFSSDWIELLIPVSIIISAGFGFFYKGNQNWKTLHLLKYISAAVFGLIHGLGFSNYLASLLGREMSVAMPLLAFNIGLEAGQIILVLLILLLSSTIYRYTKIPKRDWVLGVSGIVIGMSLEIALNRVGFLFQL
jgi:hypothetical protein